MSTQREAYVTCQALKANWTAAVPPEWGVLRVSFSSWHPALVAASHLAIDASVVSLLLYAQ